MPVSIAQLHPDYAKLLKKGENTLAVKQYPLGRVAPATPGESRLHDITLVDWK